MQTKVNYAFLCDFAFLTEEKKPGIIGIFRKIFVADVPSTHPKFFVVTSLEFIDMIGDHIVDFIMIDKEGNNVIPPFTFNTRIQDKKSEVNFIADVIMVNFKKIGDYQIQIQCDKNLIHSIPFEVEQKGQ